jgi:hypothetical protein
VTFGHHFENQEGAKREVRGKIIQVGGIVDAKASRLA